MVTGGKGLLLVEELLVDTIWKESRWGEEKRAERVLYCIYMGISTIVPDLSTTDILISFFEGEMGRISWAVGGYEIQRYTVYCLSINGTNR